MIETEPVKTLDGMILRVSPRVIVDVRKTNNVSVNMLTYLESFRLRHLVQSGMSFDEAKAQAEAEALRDSIKQEMLERDTEELECGQYIIRWTSVLTQRFDTTSFKKAMPDVYKSFIKQSASKRFSIA